LILWMLMLVFSGAALAGSTAEDLLFAGRMSEAWTLAKAEAVASPGDVEVQEVYIDLAVHLGMQPVVEAGYRARIKQTPDDALAYYCLGRSAMSLTVAKASYDRALALEPEGARAHMGIGAIYRNQGKLAEADGAYRKALLQDPTLAEAWAGLQSVLAAGGMRAEVLKAAELAVLHVGHRAEPHLTLARLQPDRAVELLETGAKLAARDPQIHVVLSQQYALSGRGRDAIGSAQTALKINPNHGNARRWLGFGRELSERRLTAAGLRDLLDLQQDIARKTAGLPGKADSLTQRFPKSALAHLLQAQIFSQEGQGQAALVSLERAASLDARNDEVQAVLGLAYLKQGTPEKARPLLLSAAKARPGDVSLGLASAQCGWELSEQEQAIEQLILLRKTHPHDVRVVLTLAGWLDELGRTAQAYDLLKEAARQSPDVRLAIAVAAAARDLGRQAEAAEILEALAIESRSPKLRAMAEQMRREAGL
jgi:tetratricopeptide (TPR) repeat protein